MRRQIGLGAHFQVESKCGLGQQVRQPIARLARRPRDIEPTRQVVEPDLNPLRLATFAPDRGDVNYLVGGQRLLHFCSRLGHLRTPIFLSNLRRWLSKRSRQGRRLPLRYACSTGRWSAIHRSSASNATNCNEMAIRDHAWFFMILSLNPLQLLCLRPLLIKRIQRVTPRNQPITRSSRAVAEGAADLFAL